MKSPIIGLSRKDARRTIRMLEELQGHLESAIESCIITGHREPREATLRGFVKRDRKMLADAERIIEVLKG